jgi:hypothetical protein
VPLRSSASAIVVALAVAVAVLGAAGGGCAPSEALRVPAGPPVAVALRVAFYLDTTGTWAIDGFREALREELAKYGVQGVDPGASPDCVAFVTLGNWSDRVGAGRDIAVELERNHVRADVGHLRVPDLSMSTLDVAPEFVAILIARALRAPPATDGGAARVD